MLLETRQPWPLIRGQVGAIDPQRLESLLRRPFREIGVEAFARYDQRREQRDTLPLVVTQQACGDGGSTLRFYCDVAIRAVLGSQLHVQESQEVIDLRQRCDGTLTSAATRTLLDGDRGRNAVNRINIRSGRWLYELTRVGVQGFEIAPLSLVEEDVECKRRFTGAGDTGDDREAITGDLNIDALEVVLSCVVDDDGVAVVTIAPTILGARFRNPGRHRRRGLSRHALLVRGQCLPGERAGMRPDLGRSSDAHDFAAPLTTIGSEVDDPVGRLDEIEVVLDHQQ